MTFEINPEYVALAQRTWRAERPSFDTNDIAIAIDAASGNAKAHRRQELYERVSAMPEPHASDRAVRAVKATLSQPAKEGSFYVSVLAPEGIVGAIAVASVPIPPSVAPTAN